MYSKQKPNIFFDDLSKICVLDPDVATETQNLRDECKNFLESADEFQTLIIGFNEKIETLGKLVEREKLKALGSRIRLRTIEKWREDRKKEFALIANEKRKILERLKSELECRRRNEEEQHEYIDRFTNLS